MADNKEVLVLNSPGGYPVPCALLPPPHSSHVTLRPHGQLAGVEYTLRTDFMFRQH